MEFEMKAQTNEVALPLRSHTILGVCEAIGEDFGFNPTFLRVPFAATVLWNPLAAIGGYFALGAVVLASRLLFPKRGAGTVKAITDRQSDCQDREMAKAA
jgi:phage shock protein C